MTGRRRPSFTGAAAIAALTLAGCGTGTSTTSPHATSTGTAGPASQSAGGGYAQPSGAAPSSPGGAGPVAQLRADPSGALRFSVATLHAKAGALTVQLADPAGSGVAHGIAVQGHGVDKDSKIVQPGATATVSVTLKAGAYTYYCPVPGHEAAGMKGTLLVT